MTRVNNPVSQTATQAVTISDLKSEVNLLKNEIKDLKIRLTIIEQNNVLNLPNFTFCYNISKEPNDD